MIELIKYIGPKCSNLTIGSTYLVISSSETIVGVFDDLNKFCYLNKGEYEIISMGFDGEDVHDIPLPISTTRESYQIY
jgi:hypothetical protein